MFPVEVWEEILQYGKAKDLARLRTVCRAWNGIIERLLTRGDVWYRQCVDEVPAGLWYSLVDHHIHLNFERSNLHKADHASEIWMKMYRSWRGWQTIVKKKPETKTFEPLAQHRPRETITSVAALNNVIATGSSEGYIAFYEIKSGRIFYRADHNHVVRSLQLIRKGELAVAVSSSTNKITKFWNLNRKSEEKAEACSASMITANFGQCYLICNTKLVQYQLSGWFGEEGCATENVPGVFISMRAELIFSGGPLEPSDELVAAGAEGNELLLFTSSNKQCRLIFGTNKCPPQISQTEIPPLEVRSYRIFNGAVVACIGIYGQFGFSVYGGPWKIYSLWGIFSSPVTSILFHVGLLALGLQCGDVHLFQIKSVADLADLDFEKMESQQLPLDRRAIIFLNIAECHSTQYLVATTAKSVHLVEFV